VFWMRLKLSSLTEPAEPHMPERTTKIDENDRGPVSHVNIEKNADSYLLERCLDNAIKFFHESIDHESILRREPMIGCWEAAL
jgi:hypothetical protein